MKKTLFVGMLAMLSVLLFVSCASSASTSEPALMSHSSEEGPEPLSTKSADQGSFVKDVTITAPDGVDIKVGYWGPSLDSKIYETIPGGTSKTIQSYIWSETLKQQKRATVTITVVDKASQAGYYLKSDNKNVYVLGSSVKGEDHTEGLFTYIYASEDTKPDKVVLRMEKAKAVKVKTYTPDTAIKGYQYCQPCKYIQAMRWIISYTEGTDEKVIYFRPDIYENIVPKQSASTFCVFMFTKESGAKMDTKGEYTWSDGKTGDSYAYKRTFSYDKLPESISGSVKM